MPNTLQIKRGLQINLPTGIAGELLFTSDTKRVYIGDGATNNLLQGASSILTTGMVSFSDSSGKLTGSSSLYWDNTNGRLGIGTSTPSEKFEIVSGAIQLSNAQGIRSRYTGGASFTILQMFSDNNTYLDGANDILFRVSAGATTAMRLKSSTGNVLINTTTDAGFKLDVNGTARVSGNTVVTTWIGVGGVTTPSGSGEKFNVQGAQVISGASGAGNFLLYQISGASRFIVGSEASIGGTANNYINYVYGNNRYITYTNNVARLSVTGDGNVLINTTTDNGYKLDVNGTARNLATYQVYRDNQLGSVDLNLYNGQSGWQGGVHYFTGTGGSGQRLTFYAGGAVGTSDRMSIFASGNIAINTTTDAGYKLDVNGTARVSGVITAPSGLSVSARMDIYNDGANGVIAMQTLTNTLNLRKYVKVLGDNGGYGNNDASASFQIDGTNRGFLPPRMTTTQKNAIASPAAGLIIFDVTLNKLCVFTTTWETVTSL